MRRVTKKIKPLKGKKYIAFLEKCVSTVASWPKWIGGVR